MNWTRFTVLIQNHPPRSDPSFSNTMPLILTGFIFCKQYLCVDVLVFLAHVSGTMNQTYFVFYLYNSLQSLVVTLIYNMETPVLIHICTIDMGRGFPHQRSMAASWITSPGYKRSYIRYVGVIRLLFQVLLLLMITFTPKINELCSIIKSAMKHQRKLDWKTNFPWFSDGVWKFVDSLTEDILFSNSCSL